MPDPDLDAIRARVTLFKPSGKYYTEEEWVVPADAIGPYDLNRSPDFRRIGGGAVLVDAQEPWGYPHLFPGFPPAPSGDGPYPRGTDATQALTEVRTVLSRAETALARKGEFDRDIDGAEMVAALKATVHALSRFRRTGKPAKRCGHVTDPRIPRYCTRPRAHPGDDHNMEGVGTP